MRVKLTIEQMRLLPTDDLLYALYDLQVRFEQSNEPILGIVATFLMVTKVLKERKISDQVITAASLGKFPEPSSNLD